MAQLKAGLAQMPITVAVEGTTGGETWKLPASRVVGVAPVPGAAAMGVELASPNHCVIGMVAEGLRMWPAGSSAPTEVSAFYLQITDLFQARVTAMSLEIIEMPSIQIKVSPEMLVLLSAVEAYMHANTGILKAIPPVTVHATDGTFREKVSDIHVKDAKLTVTMESGATLVVSAAGASITKTMAVKSALIGDPVASGYSPLAKEPERPTLLPEMIAGMDLNALLTHVNTMVASLGIRADVTFEDHKSPSTTLDGLGKASNGAIGVKLGDGTVLSMCPGAFQAVDGPCVGPVRKVVLAMNGGGSVRLTPYSISFKEVPTISVMIKEELINLLTAVKAKTHEGGIVESLLKLAPSINIVAGGASYVEKAASASVENAELSLTFESGASLTASTSGFVYHDKDGSEAPVGSISVAHDDLKVSHFAHEESLMSAPLDF